MSNVLSCFANILPAFQINNLGFNGCATMPLTNIDGTQANIEQVIFTRGGEKFPIEYNIDTIHTGDPHKDQRVLDAQIIREGMSAIRKFANMSRTMISPTNTHLVDFANPTGANANTGINIRDDQRADGGNCFIVGVNYDAISNQGVSFATQDFGINMRCGLTSNNPHAVFLFIHSKNTLVFDGTGGLQVMS